MKISETQELLRAIALLDNRTVTQDYIQAWHSIIGYLDYEVAKEALRLAQSDPSIRYLEPRHIVGWSREAKYKLERNLPQDLPPQEPSQPLQCEHGKTIALCLPCCRELADA